MPTSFSHDLRSRITGPGASGLLIQPTGFRFFFPAQKSLALYMGTIFLFVFDFTISLLIALFIMSYLVCYVIAYHSLPITAQMAWYYKIVGIFHEAKTYFLVCIIAA